MEELRVVKRTGELVPFDEGRIRGAIMKAVLAISQELLPEKMDVVVCGITDEIKSRFADFYPNVENIQDIVEKHLVKNGLYEISKEYILYRAKRQKERDEEKRKNLEKSSLGKLTARKKGGRLAIFDSKKLGKSIKLAAKGVENDVSVELITNEVLKNAYDGISTGEIERAVIFSSASFIELDPAYGKVAARVFLQKINKEVTGKSSSEHELDSNYRSAFIEGIEKGVQNFLMDKRLLDFDLNFLAKSLKVERDDLFNYTGIQTLYERYFMKLEERRIELPQGFWMRVAMGLALNEKDKNEKAVEFYEAISTMRFVPSTPTLFHSGSTHPQLSSCYLTTVSDDLGHIFKCLGDNAQLSKWSGGLGNDWTNIRATGSWIKATNVESQGVIPFLKIANDVTAAINRSGKRRGATCAYLEAWHLDIEDFLDLRKNTGDERRRTHDMDTAVWIPDLFMKRVINEGNWTLFSPDEAGELHELYGKKFEEKYLEYEKKAISGNLRRHKVLEAQKLWKRMLGMLFETGHPWITFKDPCNIRSPQDHAGIVHSSNLCTEITLNTSSDETAVCNLGSINLEKHVQDGKLDERLLAKTVKTAVRMLDNVIEVNYYPTAEAKNSNMKHRPIGLGIMGLQDAFFKLNLAFDSNEAAKFSDYSMEVIAYNAILSSSEMAKEKDKYESYTGSKWDRGIFPQDTIALLESERGMEVEISKTGALDWSPVREHVKQHGMRNSNVMAIAPTATISTIAGCYPSIEPIYKNIYVKANMSGEFTVVNNYLVDDLKKAGLWGKEMLEKLKNYDGNLQLIEEIPKELREKHKEAFEIDPELCIKMTANRGKWIDQSQSHNIFIKGTSGKKLFDVYMKAFQCGLKTTYYLRSMAASQIEKSTLDSSKYGFTQKREYTAVAESNSDTTAVQQAAGKEATDSPKACLINNPDCEACQ